MLTLANAQNALTAHANANTITSAQIAQLLQNVRGTTFAQIAYVSKVATSAANKSANVQKVTVANVQLFNNVKDFNIYANAVMRSANKLNTDANVTEFTTSETYYEHTNVYSVVKHKTNGNEYLYAVYNNSASMYFINNAPATKQEVAQLLTASASKALLQPSNTVTNVTNSVTHDVIVRTIALQNIVSINAMQQSVTV